MILICLLFYLSCLKAVSYFLQFAVVRPKLLLSWEETDAENKIKQAGAELGQAQPNCCFG